MNALQITWGPWVGIPPVVDLGLEPAVIISSGTTQLLEGAGLMVIYLAERASCQLVGKDTPQVPIDHQPFMLPLLSMTDDEYKL